MAVVRLYEEPAIAARLRAALGLAQEADLVVQFAEDADEPTGALREIHAALTAYGDDHRVLDRLRSFLLAD
jgi:hypothetical protein